MLNRSQRVLLIALAATAIGHHAFAQSSLGIGSAEPGVDTGGFLPGFFAWINTHQQQFYRSLTGALGAMRDDPWQLGGLVALSFGYGVFHAAGPGHGKAVISSYMLANEVALKRGVVLSFASALMQGLVALIVVGAAYFLLRGTAISMTQATGSLEIASFALVTAFGAWLVYRKLGVRSAAPASHSGAGHDDHDHHHHHHDHGDDCGCGHAHMPDPKAIGGETLRVREAWSAVAAVGMRPCSGALIVLTFALLNGLYLGGVLSVLAMSIGTAITVAVLATLAVGAKDVAIRFARSDMAVYRVTHAIEVFGAFSIFIIGLLLLSAALAA